MKQNGSNHYRNKILTFKQMIALKRDFHEIVKILYSNKKCHIN